MRASIRRMVIILVCCVCSSHAFLRAEVPFEQAQGLYENTAREYQDISPFWAPIALKSKILERVRFYGSYSSAPNPKYPRHPAFETSEKERERGIIRETNNCPQDAISAVIQYLYPSPDGHIFVPNERNKDPIGQIVTEHQKKMPGPAGLKKIEALVLGVAAYKGKIKSLGGDKTALQKAGTEFAVQVCVTLRNAQVKIADPAAVRQCEELLSKAESRPESKTARPTEAITGFDRTRKLFSELLVRAVAEEVADSNQEYPPDIIEEALLAFAWKSANSVNEIYDAFPALVRMPRAPPGAAGAGAGVAMPPTPVFSYDAYKAGLPEFLSRIRNEKNDVSPQMLGMFLMGYGAYDDPVGDLIYYKTTSYGKEEFSDCGETALRNFFNIVWQTNGIVPRKRIDSFIAALWRAHSAGGISPDISKLLEIRQFYKHYSAISSGGLAGAHAEWAAIVSNLNALPSHPITYRQRTCNVQGAGVQNMLNVIAHLIPDDQLRKPWPPSTRPHEQYAQVAAKLTRLCTLFSRDGFTLDWSVNDEKEITSNFVQVTFSIQDKPAFVWNFLEGHFEVESVADNAGEDWRRVKMHGPANAWLDCWLLRYQQPRFEGEALLPYQVYGQNLAGMALAGKVINTTLQRRWRHKMQQIPLWVNKTFPLGDLAAQTALMAVLFGHEDMFRSMTDPSFEPLRKFFAEHKKLAAARTEEIYDLAEKNGYPETMARFMGDPALPQEAKDAMLAIVAGKGDLVSARLLIAHGADVNFDRSRSPLDRAASGGHVDMLRFLLTQGARIDVPSMSFGGWTPLIFAISGDQQRAAEFLLEQHANVNLATFKGHSALMLAAWRGYTRIVRLLLERGARSTINDADDKGQTALHWACRTGDNLAVLRLLVEQGANLRATARNGDTPLSIATGRGYRPMVEFIEAELAKQPR